MRISVTALLDLHDGDRWILVAMPEDRPGEYGPFGGIFKYEDSAREALAQLEFEPEAGLATRQAMRRNDIRGYIPVRRLRRFLAWWNSGKGRESGEDCVRRELHEELVDASLQRLLPEASRLRLIHLRSLIEGPRRIPTASGNYWQIRLFEVYAARADEVASFEALRTLVSKSTDAPNNVISVSARDIREGRTAAGTIGGHTEYLLSNRRNRFEPPGRGAAG
jgi:hypothetical protein